MFEITEICETNQIFLFRGLKGLLDNIKQNWPKPERKWFFPSLYPIEKFLVALNLFHL